MKRSPFSDKHSRIHTFFDRPSSIVHRPSSPALFQSSRGFTYIGLLAIIVIIGISLGAAGKYWSNVMLRDKEEELLFRGDQYRQAIERYFLAIPGRPEYPPSIDNLLTDNRTASGKRHLRQKYKDPITGTDFVEIRNEASKRITGVHSSSEKLPLKQGNFPERYEDFEEKSKYTEWEFVSTVVATSAQVPVQRRFRNKLTIPTVPPPQ